MEGMMAHQLFVALKLHFTTNYDYFKYGGKTRKINESKFQNRRDLFTYIRLERRYKENLEGFIVSNMARGGINWVGDLNTTNAEHIYDDWKRRMESLHYLIELDVIAMSEENTSTLFKAIGGNHPLALRMYLGNKIAIETLIGLNEVLHFQQIWDKKIPETVVWPDVSKLMNKYTPFIKSKISKDQMRQIIEEKLT